MANENKFDSGTPHVVIDVQHPSGETHSVAVPTDTNVADLHNALMDAGYEHPAIPNTEKGPTKGNILENTQTFRDASKAAWSGVASGLIAKEAGFNVDKRGRAGTITEREARNGEVPSVEMGVSPQAMALVHTHPSVGGFSPRPSKNDIEVAKQTKKTVYVVGSQGLFAVDPGGDVTNVYSDPDWMKK